MGLVLPLAAGQAWSRFRRDAAAFLTLGALEPSKRSSIVEAWLSRISMSRDTGFVTSAYALTLETSACTPSGDSDLMSLTRVPNRSRENR